MWNISHSPWLKKSQNTYISLLISPWMFDLSYSVDIKNNLEKILKHWSIKSLHCNFLILINQLMWFLFLICNIFIHPNLMDPTDPSLHNQRLISTQFTDRKQSEHFLVIKKIQFTQLAWCRTRVAMPTIDLSLEGAGQSTVVWYTYTIS